MRWCRRCARFRRRWAIRARGGWRSRELGPSLPVIDESLEVDPEPSGEQWHTAKRIFERLREQHGFDGGYTVVKDYVRMSTREAARSSCR